MPCIQHFTNTAASPIFPCDVDFARKRALLKALKEPPDSRRCEVAPNVVAKAVSLTPNDGRLLATTVSDATVTHIHRRRCGTSVGFDSKVTRCLAKRNGYCLVSFIMKEPARNVAVTVIAPRASSDRSAATQDFASFACQQICKKPAHAEAVAEDPATIDAVRHLDLS